jgi:hypothetical protein
MKTLLALTFLTGALPLTALASFPLEGTWRVDWAMTSPDLLDKYELKDGYYSCLTCAPAFRVKADGQDQPLSGVEGIDSISVSVKNDYQLRLLRKLKGALVSSEIMIVSDDGRHLKGMTYSGPEQEESGSADNVRLGNPAKGQHLVSGVWVAPGLRQSERDSTLSYRMVEGRLELKGEDGESYSAPLDGSIVPLKGNPGANRVAVLKLSDRVISTQQFKDNDLVRTMQITVSSDGQLMSINFQEHEASGNLIVRRVAPAR